MVKQLFLTVLLLFGLLFLGMQQVSAQVPSEVCLGGCPSPSTSSSSSSAPVSVAPAAGNPCPSQSVLQQGAPSQAHKKQPHHHQGGFLEDILPVLLQFLQLILQLIPGSGTTSLPCPAATASSMPAQPSSSSSDSSSNQSSSQSSSSQPSSSASSATGGGNTQNVEITFYGSYDNDPSGSLNISNPVIHQQAGGTGTFADPLTFASPAGTGEYTVGTKIYVPLVQKYFIREDTCATSWTAPNGCGAVTHVDLYVGNPSDSKAVVACEDSLTPSANGQIIINPPSNLPYDPTPIWTQSTNTCMKAH